MQPQLKAEPASTPQHHLLAALSEAWTGCWFCEGVFAHLVAAGSQDAESKQHGGDADEQLQNQEDHQGPQDPVDQQLWKQQRVRKQLSGGSGVTSD